MLGEAEEIIGAGDSPPAQFVRVSRVDADSQSPRLQFSHGIFEVGEWRIRQASEIDDVGALDAQHFGASDNGLEAHLRRIDDLSEDAQRMARQIEGCSGLAEKHWQVFQFIGTALERHVKFLSQPREVSATTARD